MITLYEIGSELPDKTFSPWAAKARLVLNYKRIPHRTVWFPYTEVAQRSIALGIPPNDLDPRADGSAHYTIPAIHDASTNTFVVDSSRIILYLDQTYPDTPRVIKDTGSMSANVAFEKAVIDVMFKPHIFVPAALGWMGRVDATTQVGFKALLETLIGMSTEKWLENEEANAEPHWVALKDKFDVLDGFFDRAEKLGCAEGIASGGGEMTFADASVGGMLVWMQRGLGEESEGWKRVRGLNGGRWGRLYDGLKPFMTVHE